jgi:hypothetical protein
MTNKHKYLIILMIVLILSHITVTSYPLEVETHQQINLKVADLNTGSFLLDSYLKDTLGFRNGLEELVDKWSIGIWLQRGGLFEDLPWNPPFDFTPPYLRSVNHFHNPITDRGFSGFAFGVLLSGDSSVRWAQKPLQTQDPGGHYSWNDARSYLYDALTIRNKTLRERYFAETFRALGQLMHLVQDASVPEHVRDDFHVTGYEKWVQKNVNINAVNPSGFDRSIFNRFTSELPIANIFDTNQYDGTDPNVTAGTNIGLTEYTNANFFSGDTITSQRFDYPKIELTTLVERPYITKFGDPYVRQYYLKNCCGETNGPNGYLLSAVDCLDYWRKRDPSLSEMAQIPVLDENVYDAYARLLLPKALSYSAGLLEYFFRGKLHVDLLVPSVDQANYSFNDRSDTGRNIDKVAMFIQNNSKLNGAVEPAGQGEITLTVGYKNNQTGETFFIHGGTASITEIPAVGNENALIVLFTLAEPVPTQSAKDITYYLVFRGRLGNEEDAVIGKVITAPVLYSVTPDYGIERDVVTISGDNLPDIAPPYTTAAENIKFNHIVTSPYSVEVISKTDTEITVRVPDTAALEKPGYGGLRLRKAVGEGEEKESIYSNPIPFYPIAEGSIENSTGTWQNVTMRALAPIAGDYSPLPLPVVYQVAPNGSEWIELITGFTYEAVGNPGTRGSVQDIFRLNPNPTDFEFYISPSP